MASLVGKRAACQLARQARHFSSTVPRHAATVKSLGVIGAGQMVRRS